MNRKMAIMSIAIAILFGGIIAFNLFKAYMMKRYFANFVPPAVTVSSVTAVKQNWTPHINAVGNFVAINGVEVGSQASGNVVAIHFDSGQFVPANTPLIDLDDSVDQATLKSNQSELALQQINHQRQVDLFKHGATPSSSLDAAKAKLLQSEADVEKTSALIRQKHILAPFAGQVGIRQVNLGQYVTPGQTPIVTLQSMDPIYLKFYLPEQLFKSIHVNQLITFSTEQNPDLVFKGTITAINSKVDPSMHNIEVQATLPNCPVSALKDPYHSSEIKAEKIPYSHKTLITCDSKWNENNKIVHFNFIPGMFANIKVVQPSVPNQIVLPTTAIIYSLYGNSVYIIEKDEHDKSHLTVKRVFIDTGDQEGNSTVINNGVKEGQLVVNSGDLKLQDGTRVVINNEVQLKTTDNISQIGQ